MRHVKLKPGSKVDAAALDDLIEAAYRDGRARAAKGFVDDDANGG
jgi:hypothetical protein